MARYSKKYLVEHETNLSIYRETRAEMDRLLNGAKLPKMDAPKMEGRELVLKKKLPTASIGRREKKYRKL